MFWYFTVLGKYIDFKGRASRKEYWTFWIINLIISVLLFAADRALQTSDKFGVTILGLYNLAVLLPAMAVLVRRLHDVGKSGKMALLAFTGVGLVWIFILILAEGQEGSNKWGENPNPKQENPLETHDYLDYEESDFAKAIFNVINSFILGALFFCSLYLIVNDVIEVFVDKDLNSLIALSPIASWTNLVLFTSYIIMVALSYLLLADNKRALNTSH